MTMTKLEARIEITGPMAISLPCQHQLPRNGKRCSLCDNLLPGWMRTSVRTRQALSEGRKTFADVRAAITARV